MAPHAASLRTLLRTSTTLRLTTPQAPRTFTCLPPRSPSPPPTYQSRNYTVLASTNQWTRFRTPYTYSSVRTFTRSPRSLLASSAPATSPDAAATIEKVMEQIQDMYGTARDEFEMAAEETEKNTTYAEDDRAAAREELDKLLEYYTGLLEGEDRAVAEEVKRRVGQRIRELEQAVLALEESVTHGD